MEYSDVDIEYLFIRLDYCDRSRYKIFEWNDLYRMYQRLCLTGYYGDFSDLRHQNGGLGRRIQNIVSLNPQTHHYGKFWCRHRIFCLFAWIIVIVLVSKHSNKMTYIGFISDYGWQGTRRFAEIGDRRRSLYGAKFVYVGKNEEL